MSVFYFSAGYPFCASAVWPFSVAFFREMRYSVPVGRVCPMSESFFSKFLFSNTVSFILTALLSLFVCISVFKSLKSFLQIISGGILMRKPHLFSMPCCSMPCYCISFSSLFHLALILLSFISVLLLPCVRLSAGETPSAGIDAVLILDVSGSMMHSDPDYRCRDAAETFIQELSSLGSARVGIISFSDQLQLSTSLMDLDTPEGQSGITDLLDTLSYTRGDTDIGLAIRSAEELLMRESSPERARCMLLLTDGEIDLPRAEDEEAAENDSLAKALVTVEDAASSGITIHTVMLDPTGTLDPNLCRYMADRTGGSSVITVNAEDLPGLFRSVSGYARGQARDLAASLIPETEAETEPLEETEAVTEEVPETETEPQPVILTTGSIDESVILKGLLPNMCSASLNLSELFRYSPDADSSAEMRFTAFSSDSSVLQCTVEGEKLLIKGTGAGSSAVTVYAESSDEFSKNQLYAKSEPIRFDVTISPVFSSLKIPLLIGAGILAVTCILLLLLLLLSHRGRNLAGSLQWYVKAEDEKIYGVPSQTLAHLENYGKKVYLSELIDDDLLDEVNLRKVVLTGLRNDDGIFIRCHTRDILLSDQSNTLSRSLYVTGETRFRILCQTGRGKISVIAQYLPYEEIGISEQADTSEERTRLLIPDEYRRAG